jgi:NADPH-dependent FMN reductase
MLRAVEAALAAGGYSEVQSFAVATLALAYCQGEFDCWVKTPGVCRSRDEQADILKAVHDADAVVFMGPLTFGGHGFAIKRVLDRFLCLLEPFFVTRNSLTHHGTRYERHQRFFSIAWASRPDADQTRTFADLADANAINYLAPECGSVVLDDTAHPTAWSVAIADLLARPRSPGATVGERATLRAELLAAASPSPSPLGPCSRAAVLIGSPKRKGTSVSEVLATALQHRLERQGLTCELHAATEFVHDSPKANAQAQAISRCDLLVVVTPLYADALPSITTHALELIARARPYGTRQAASFVTVINCGFPEPEQTRTALRIARHFADAAGYHWGGALPIGAGGTIRPDRPLDDQHGPGAHLAHALTLAAPALARTGNLPLDAITAASAKVLPDFLYRLIGDLGWRWQAYQAGLSQRALHDRPLGP